MTHRWFPYNFAALACCLVFSVGCRDKDDERKEGTLPEVRVGEEVFHISGDLNQESSALTGSGSLRSVETLFEGQNTFELEFSFPTTKSSLALHLYSRPGYTDGLNIRFYEKDGNLETFTDYTDDQGKVVSAMQKLGSYALGQTSKLRLAVELSAELPPQIEIVSIASEQELESRLNFDANVKPFLPQYNNWGIYLGDAHLQMVKH